jgi:FkbM family methyltransferase
MNRVLLFKKISKYCAKLGLGRSQKIVNLYEETFSKISSGVRLEYIKIDGQKLYLDKEDSLLLSTRKDDYDKFEIECLKQIIKKGDIVVDLGANIGYYTLILAQLVGELGHVYAFEPEPSNFELLSKNVKENNHNHVTLVQKAVSDKNSKINLYVSKRNFASHRIFDGEDKRESIEIDVITLDEYFKNFEKPIKFIKIDVEGAEGATLLGASKIIKNSKNLVIMMEYFPKWIKKFGDVPEEILKSLVEKKFKLFNINKKNKKLDSILITNFIEEYNEQKKNYTNVLCSKGEKFSITPSKF